MEHVKYLIIGAGPAGLTFANRLLDGEEHSFLLLERDGEPGGLCRSMAVDDGYMDIGGGHFLDVRRPLVNAFLFRFLPETEWNRFSRDSRIAIRGQLIHHPLEANIWELALEDQIEYLKSIAAAGCNAGAAAPEAFVPWIYWKLGDRIAEDYMIPYNRKMFGEGLTRLGTYWLDKLPNVSFEETLRSCLVRRAYGTQPGHAEFYYPKDYGYGEVWLRMGKQLGGRLRVGTPVRTLDFTCRQVSTAAGEAIGADCIVNTAPWRSFTELRGLDESLRQGVSRLLHTSVETRYFSGRMDTPAQWVYYPDDALPYHRILIRHNFSRSERGYWTETNANRVQPGGEEFAYRNEYNYPLNTVHKPDIMKRLLSFARERGVYGLGRWGEHEHYNSDLTVEKALSLADAFLAGEGGNDA